VVKEKGYFAPNENVQGGGPAGDQSCWDRGVASMHKVPGEIAPRVYSSRRFPGDLKQRCTYGRRSSRYSGAILKRLAAALKRRPNKRCGRARLSAVPMRATPERSRMIREGESSGREGIGLLVWRGRPRPRKLYSGSAG